MTELKNWILALAIAIVLNLFVNYGISVFYKDAQYNDFCMENGPYREPYYPAKPYPEFMQQNCTPVYASQELRDSCTSDVGNIQYKYNATGCPTEAYCETCFVRFENLRQTRNSNVFVALVVFGVIAILTGIMLKEEAVANGFLIGGIISLVIAAIRNWGQLQDIFKFAILGLVLALLIWVGYRKGKIIPRRK